VEHPPPPESAWDPGPIPPEPEPPRGPDHPIRLVVTDDRRRSRLTVFFRLLLAIPHLIWYFLWSIATVVVVVIGWFIALFTGRMPEGLHGFVARYVRYGTHLFAYLTLAANPFPGFAGDPGYPIDVEIDGPERQSRWKTAFRLLLAVPALVIEATLLGLPGAGSGGSGAGGQEAGGEDAVIGIGIAFLVAFFAWFACLVRGRMPHGFRHLNAYALRYYAQTYGYLFLLTDRYPFTGPFDVPDPEPPPPAPIRIAIDDDLRRSRLTVLLRLPLAFPHLVWLGLWSVAAVLAALLNWLVTLAVGRSPAALHRFLAAFLRYQTHVYAFLSLVANPFPGFTGTAGSYPVDLEIDGPHRQHRLVTLFRTVLAIPAWFLALSLFGLLFAVAIFGWFVSLALGRMPEGLRDAGAFVLRYAAQANGYGFHLLTDRYPYSGPADRRLAPPDAEAEPPPPLPPLPPEPPPSGLAPA